MITVTRQLCCPRCRLRFTPAAAAYISACPECGDPPQTIANRRWTSGFRLVGPADLPDELPNAPAVPTGFPSRGARL
jgi:hypothetical protein